MPYQIPTYMSGEGPSRRESPASDYSHKRDFEYGEAKKRRVQRACDVCRRKKIKCDGPMNSHSASKCAHCEEYNLDCTYIEGAKRRGPPKGYVETLEQRCIRLEGLLHQRHPGVNFDHTVGPPLDRDDFDLARYNDTLSSLSIPQYPSANQYPSVNQFPPVKLELPSPQSHEHPADDEEDHRMHLDIARNITKLGRDVTWRFHGKASPHHLFVVFNELRKRRNGEDDLLEELKKNRRSEFWETPEWELVVANENIHPVDWSLWPERDLAETLIEAYFDRANSHLPLLNRPFFLKEYRSGLYRTKQEFAKVCWMVFANGARFVTDERVLWSGAEQHSAGWKYLLGLLRMGKNIMQGPNLHDFQAQVLVCTFMMGSAQQHLTWMVSGLGLRAAQEVGIHVRSILLHADPIERALYNRAFWCLYHIDRLNCASIGRSVALQDTDFNADYPIAVDDEYWDTGDSARNFIQPRGVSKVSAFVHLLKLDHIVGSILNKIYAVNNPERDQKVVAQLDSALTAWLDAIPDGLRWDPTRADLEQPAVLQAQYYYCQILIHRPFIPTAKNPEASRLPSLAICSNASRSICNILDALRRHNCPVHVTFMLPAWVASVILLISIYLGQLQPSERERALEDVQKCIAAMQDIEQVWRQAGKMTDLLREMTREASNTPSESSSHSRKRSYDGASLLPETADVSLAALPPSEIDFLGAFGLDMSSFELPQSDGVDLWDQLFGSFSTNAENGIQPLIDASSATFESNLQQFQAHGPAGPNGHVDPRSPGNIARFEQLWKHGSGL